jgi:hypothetical protein
VLLCWWRVKNSWDSNILTSFYLFVLSTLLRRLVYTNNLHEWSLAKNCRIAAQRSSRFKIEIRRSSRVRLNFGRIKHETSGIDAIGIDIYMKPL